MTLSPEAQATVDAGKARTREVWDGRRPLTIPAATLIADATLLDVGWTVWSKHRRVDALRGGVIVQVLEATVTDDDTGEIVDRLAWRVRDPYRVEKVDRIDAAQVVLPDEAEPPNRSNLVAMIRTLARQIGNHDQYWLTATELAVLADMWRLTVAVSV